MSAANHTSQVYEGVDLDFQAEHDFIHTIQPWSGPVPELSNAEAPQTLVHYGTIDESYYCFVCGEWHDDATRRGRADCGLCRMRLLTNVHLESHRRRLEELARSKEAPDTEIPRLEEDK